MKPRFPLLSLLSLLALGALAPGAAADVLSGKVVDASGAPLGGVDLDFVDKSDGSDPDPANDGTAADGTFSVVLPPGIYDVTFNPPPPPLSTSLVLTVEDVVVVGTVSMGTVSLQQGVVVTGRTVTTTGSPVAGVGIDVVVVSTDEKIDLTGDETDSFGSFAVAVPAEPIELELDATPVSFPKVASKMIPLAPSAAVDLGDIVLPPGHTVSGFVVKSGGGAVVDADLDFRDASGAKVFTPGDNTDLSGFVSVVVPAGTYEVTICPQLADLLVAGWIPSLAVSATTSIGTQILQPGHLLSGTVTAASVAVPDVDVDVQISATSQEVPLCNDDTGPAGTYAVVVPSGALEVSFSPPYDVPLGGVTKPISVFGPATLDASLPDCPFSTSYGVGTVGTGGFVPVLDTSGGTPRPGNDAYTFEVQDGLGGALSVLVFSVQQTSLPALGGTVLVDPTTFVAQAALVLSGSAGAAGQGELSWPMPVPITSVLVGVSVHGQLFVIDGGAPAGFAMSAGRTVTFCE